MRADNTAHLQKAAAARHEHTRQRAVDALKHLESTGAIVTVACLARSAGVARSWIYTQPDLLDRITAQVPSTRAAVNPRTAASEESWQRRIDSHTSGSRNSPKKTSNSELNSPSRTVNAEPDKSPRPGHRPQRKMPDHEG